MRRGEHIRTDSSRAVQGNLVARVPEFYVFIHHMDVGMDLLKCLSRFPNELVRAFGGLPNLERDFFICRFARAPALRFLCTACRHRKQHPHRKQSAYDSFHPDFLIQLAVSVPPFSGICGPLRAATIKQCSTGGLKYTKPGFLENHSKSATSYCLSQKFSCKRKAGSRVFS